jgi:hypothetical protein
LIFICTSKSKLSLLFPIPVELIYLIPFFCLSLHHLLLVRVEELRKGSVDEGDHIACCPYRPLHCLFNPGVCEEAVPYHNFLLHLKSHYLEPNYGRALTTQVLVTKEDFQFNQNWYPKWLSWEEMHFFILLSHKRGKSPGVNGTWLCWVQMFGTKEEAVDFYYEIEVFKGPTKKLSGRFTVQPIRTSKEEIFKSKSGLAFTDKTTKQITGIGDLQLTGCSLTHYDCKISCALQNATAKSITLSTSICCRLLR